MKNIYTSKVFSFIAGVVDTVDKHSFAKPLQILEKKNWKGPNGILRDSRDTDLWKKLENLVYDSL